MPLILFTGYPSSGKTTYVNQLIKLLNDKINNDSKLSNYKIILHNDKSLGINHNDYITSQDERKLRSKITSAVRRDLSKSNIVIVDSLNYIKGSRYQLHCEVKNLSTSFICIHIMAPINKVLEWNKVENQDLSIDHTHWDDQLLNDLIKRYEEPNENNKWDSPLFPIITQHDSFNDNNNNNNNLIEQIYNIVFNTKSSAVNNNNNNNNNKSSSSLSSLSNNNNSTSTTSLKPNSVTILKPAKQSNFIQCLEIETTKVNKVILQHLKEQDSIGNVSTAGNLSRIIIQGEDIDDDDCIYVDLNSNSINLPKLQRLKRQFIQLNKLRDLDLNRIMFLYSDYLTKNLSD